MSRRELQVVIGHLGWSQRDVGLEVYAGNDPGLSHRTRLLADDNALPSGIANAEGATVLLVVLPGRFAPDNLAAHLAAVVHDTVLPEVGEL